MVLTRILSMLRPDARLLDKLLSPPPLANPAMGDVPRLKALLNLPDAVNIKAVQEASMAAMQKAVEHVNAYLQENRGTSSIRFQLHADSNQMYAEIVDQETGRIVKIIPSPSMLDISARLKRAGGMLVDTSS